MALDRGRELGRRRRVGRVASASRFARCARDYAFCNDFPKAKVKVSPLRPLGSALALPSLQQSLSSASAHTSHTTSACLSSPARYRAPVASRRDTSFASIELSQSSPPARKSSPHAHSLSNSIEHHTTPNQCAARAHPTRASSPRVHERTHTHSCFAALAIMRHRPRRQGGRRRAPRQSRTISSPSTRRCRARSQ